MLRLSMEENDDDGFDLIEPLLFQQLKKILDQYPGDDQILKELIQNAEDASATQVKFLYDKNSYGTKHLYDEELAQFQGPALYAYNDAKFTAEDWKGIQLVSDSIKVGDPLKVGRFGLRFKSVFHLTETLYSAEKGDTLFQSFMAEAHMMLLFLQHVECIELYVREKSESNPRRLFQVKVADESLQTVRSKRNEFCEKIIPGKVMSESISVTYPITIETVKFDSPVGDVVKQQSFLVTNYLCGGQVSSQFRKLMTDKELGYLPTVGVAMGLPTNPKLQTPAIQGHVFCSLPLPTQKTSLTGLPVHVNGFFALSQNRRHIKTLNAEQDDQERTGRQLTDKSLLWNKCLLEEAIPRAYVTMIMEAINGSSRFNIAKLSIYKAWPDVSSIDQKWKGLEEPLFQLLLEEEVVHTQAQGGRWVAVDEAIIQRLLGDEPNDLLLRILLTANLPAVTVPSHVLSAVDMYAPRQVEITPSLIRRVLRQTPSCYTSLCRRDKLLLLQFSLSDKEFKDLHGLQLLPLANGKYAKFENRTSPVYISTPQHPQELLPGLDDRIVDTNIDEDILQNLQAAASQGHMQLRLLSREYITALLWYSLPPDWKKSETVSWYPGATNQRHPPKQWIKVVWKYLRQQFTTAVEIQSLGKLPLIPVSMSQTPVTLTRLSNPSRVVVKHLNDVALDDSLTDVLTKLGLIVLNDLPIFISHHPGVLGTFVNPPSVHGVLNAMLVSSSQMAVGKFSEIVRKEVSTEGKHILRSFLANVQDLSAGTEKYKLLCSLPIFETWSKKFVSKQECQCAAPAERLPIPLLRDPIDIAEVDSKRLAVHLNVRILKPTEFFCEMTFPEVRQGIFSGERIDKLMLYILEHFAHVIRTDANFKKNLQILPFVPNQRRRVRALDLFDPRNDTLTKIFAGEDVFPAGILYNKRTVLEMLEDLGMKTESYITSKDLYQSAKLVSMLPHLVTVEQKSNAILDYLSDHPQKLHEKVNGQPLGVLLRDIYWVSRLQQRTPNFPPSLPWLERDTKEVRHFCKPTELVSRHFSDVIGTVKPVVDVEASTQIAKYFGWNNKPDVLEVVKHLERVICYYSKDEKPYYMVIVDQIYSFLSHADAAAVNRAFDSVEISDWVWNGDGFSAPNHLLCSKPSIDLTPYILTLPSEMVKHSHLFYPFGVREQSDASVLVQVLSMIKKKYDDVQFSPSEAKRDLQLSVDILNEVASEDLSPELQAKILLPVHVEGHLYVRLEPVEHCMYCEHEWLKIEGDDQEMEYFYVHPNVPNGTSERLGVLTLANRMLNPHELFIGEEFGQEEKLATRLNRLLEDYTDGFVVPKELIQNADDAGATEVRFLYDERTNEDATTCLIDEGMRGCEGPALWVCNDPMFEDEDFVNITELNLKSAQLIPAKHGTVMTVSSFYDPSNVVFQSILPEDKFPLEPFNSEEWPPFLKEIGLVQVVSSNDFVRFATQVASEGATTQTKDTFKKSAVLVRYLIIRPNVVREGLLRLVRDIPFVAAHPVRKPLRELCPPFANYRYGQTPFVAFKGTIFSEYEEIVWTKAPLHPRWADPLNYLDDFNFPHGNLHRYLDALLAQLQVVKMPTVDLVVGHCQTICDHLESNNHNRRNLSSEQCSTIKGVMEHIYRFLQGTMTGYSAAKNLLQSTRCVLVEQGTKLILPCQAVLELYEDLEIRPYLYRVPPEFGKFRQVFELLGCSKSVRPTHYAMVLNMLQQNCQNDKLHPNEVSKCSKAVKGLFESLQENPEDASTLSQLYLPATSPGCGSPTTHLNTIPVTLHQSKELMFIDAPFYGSRIQGLDKLFVLDLSSMEVSCKSAMGNYKDLILMLPSALQPKMLSLAVKEKLSNSECDVIGTSRSVDALKGQLSSQQFGRGMIRIIKHDSSRHNNLSDEVIANVERGLRSMELFAVEGLKTSLFLDDSPIPGSEAKVEYLQEKKQVSAEEVWRVYVNSPTGIDDTTSHISSVSKVIVEMYGEFLGKEAFVIPEMLRHPPEKIWSLLDRMGIRGDDTYNPIETDIYPEPGSFIPIEDHHLLNDSFEEFQPGEYVGYQLDDPSLHMKDGAPTYIYAKIIEATDQDAVLLTKMYRINIGHGKETLAVSGADLHKFYRLREISAQERSHINKQQIFDDISDVLEDAWRLPEEKRRQIVKRLYLRWHPDKNIGEEEFCPEAFQHIQSVICRLGGAYGDFFVTWGARAKEHGSQREEYKESFLKQYGSWGSSSEHTSWRNVPPSFCKKNSQPGEAARWFRQAEADLVAAASEVAFNRPSYEWACFKCHQAAEKALKACQYKLDADTRTNIHNLVENCCGLDDSRLDGLASQLEFLVGESTRMRYPDRKFYPQIPNDVYSAEMAKEALEIATKIVERVRDRLT